MISEIRIPHRPDRPFYLAAIYPKINPA